ncbi:MAG TPA: type II secretion system minor pseudopilin GspI, partial [Burkholderiales bacterium]|nr:type II secretion system minor pseudopilin GspI [Burkholderiales bacterium]
SVALLAALRAAGQATQAVDELRLRLFAGWVAQNRLAEHRARGDWLAPGISRGAQRQAGADFAWREEVIGTPNPAFRRVDVFVTAPATPSGDARVLARLTGFVVRPPPGSR